MGFPHCPICVALVALSFLLAATRALLSLMFIKLSSQSKMLFGKLIFNFSRYGFAVFVGLMIYLASTLYPTELLAIEGISLNPALSNLSKDFSENFCASIRDGMTPEKAGENAVNQLPKGLFISSVMNEIMSTPKESLTLTLSQNIEDECGENLGTSKAELNDYLAQLANKVPRRSPRSFPIMQ